MPREPKAKARAARSGTPAQRPVTPLLTVDCVAQDGAGRILLIRRKNAPFASAYALPGGFVDVGEAVEDACRRELLEETGVKAGKLHLVGVYSDPWRDPRGHTVSVAFATKVRSQAAKAGDDAASLAWVENWRKEKLAFDHARVLRDAMKVLRVR